MKLGDVIFQNLPCVWLVNLINQVQGKGPHHCGIVTGFFLGIPLITEAFIFGVWTIPLPLFILRWPFGIKVKSWVDQSKVSTIVNWVLSKEGKPYNIYYSYSDNAYYCSSLISKAYQFALGVPMPCLKTIKEVELSDPPAVNIYQEILNALPDPEQPICLPRDLQNSGELE